MGRLSEYINGGRGTYTSPKQTSGLTGVSIDSRQVDSLLAALDDENLKRQILLDSVYAGAKTLKGQAINLFRQKGGEAVTHRSPWTGKPFYQSISITEDEGASTPTVQVSIMPDFRMKWFEKGTDERKTKGRRITGYTNSRRTRLKREGKGRNTGVMLSKKGGAMYFFRDAAKQQNPILEAMIKSIDEAMKL